MKLDSNFSSRKDISSWKILLCRPEEALQSINFVRMLKNLVCRIGNSLLVRNADYAFLTKREAFAQNDKCCDQGLGTS